MAQTIEMQLETIAIVGKLDNGDVHQIFLTENEHDIILGVLKNLQGQIKIMPEILQTIDVMNKIESSDDPQT